MQDYLESVGAFLSTAAYSGVKISDPFLEDALTEIGERDYNLTFVGQNTKKPWMRYYLATTKSGFYIFLGNDKENARQHILLCFDNIMDPNVTRAFMCYGRGGECQIRDELSKNGAYKQLLAYYLSSELLLSQTTNAYME